MWSRIERPQALMLCFKSKGHKNDRKNKTPPQGRSKALLYITITFSDSINFKVREKAFHWFHLDVSSQKADGNEETTTPEGCCGKSAVGCYQLGKKNKNNKVCLLADDRQKSHHCHCLYFVLWHHSLYRPRHQCKRVRDLTSDTTSWDISLWIAARQSWVIFGSLVPQPIRKGWTTSELFSFRAAGTTLSQMSANFKSYSCLDPPKIFKVCKPVTIPKITTEKTVLWNSLSPVLSAQSEHRSISMSLQGVGLM